MSSSDNDDENKSNQAPFLSDIAKKIVSIGVGAAFMTEDTVKNVLKDLPLPKEIITGLIQNAKSSKEDLIKSVQEELRNYLKEADYQKIIDNLVENYDIEINAKVNFKKKKSKKSS